MKQIYNRIIAVLQNRLNIDYNNFIDIELEEDSILITIRYRVGLMIDIDINIEVQKEEESILQIYITNILFSNINLEDFISTPLYEIDIESIIDIDDFILDTVAELKDIIIKYNDTIYFYLELKNKNNINLPLLTNLLNHDYRPEWEETEW